MAAEVAQALARLQAASDYGTDADLSWPTDYWIALALAWVEAEPRLVASVSDELAELASERRRGTQNLRHRARRVLARASS